MLSNTKIHNLKKLRKEKVNLLRDVFTSMKQILFVIAFILVLHIGLPVLAENLVRLSLTKVDLMAEPISELLRQISDQQVADAFNSYQPISQSQLLKKRS